jgi:hypothetical protein
MDRLPESLVAGVYRDSIFWIIVVRFNGCRDVFGFGNRLCLHQQGTSNCTSNLIFIIEMSFVAGSLAGALVMGGVSNLLSTKSGFVLSNRPIILDLSWVFELGANQVSNNPFAGIQDKFVH